MGPLASLVGQWKTQPITPRGFVSIYLNVDSMVCIFFFYKSHVEMVCKLTMLLGCLNSIMMVFGEET